MVTLLVVAGRSAHYVSGSVTPFALSFILSSHVCLSAPRCAPPGTAGESGEYGENDVQTTILLTFYIYCAIPIGFSLGVFYFLHFGACASIPGARVESFDVARALAHPPPNALAPNASRRGHRRRCKPRKQQYPVHTFVQYYKA